ncbi:MAG: thiol reductase thioredoxin [Candidatus Methanomarinus sp.]|jgi:thioredoxin 1|uniref:Thiol reductase thioredoxin n=1 Tax=Candidatus Methanomarinus sp. TaxID=3386244 RepID=A0AC61SBP8_9EURY|nr:MAG: thioredoxin 1 [ANME-2 cluster archaeon]KAF5430326.1 thioredoxin 1 [ANME-2 cluster archaeon]MCK5217239.1 thiol reductase thioredoxin [Methanosarcinales archaeon]MEA3295227.1 thioredoxin domain-containing protein [Euryarchaeota archaeon]TKY92012.1 MAG: thiol reductase thioredoxin [ANME-2 cluster archaeon]
MSDVIFMDFYTEWCGPCKMQDPIIEELEKKFAGSVEFKKIDADKNMEMSAKYGIQAIPTLLIEKDGKIFKKYVGVTKSNVLEADLNEALK